MINLSSYNLTIGRTASAADWFGPILARGRGAAFVDTGFITALIFKDDQYSRDAQRAFRVSRANFYTTNLVLAEVVRQITKAGNLNASLKNQHFAQCSRILVDSEDILVCAPPRDIVITAYSALRESRTIHPSLDLCDLLSLVVLDYAHHRRVLGFDTHFRSFGAQLEP